MSHSHLPATRPVVAPATRRWFSCAARRLVHAGACSAMFVVVGVAMPTASYAALAIFSSQGGGPGSGNARENFDALMLGNGSGQITATGVTVNFSGSAGAVQGSVAGVYKAPFLSGNNGNGFGVGGTNQALGVNASTFLSTTTLLGGFGSIDLLLPVASTYLGLLWGSIGADDTLELFDGATLVGSLTGSDVTAFPNDAADASGTRYVNITSTLSFNRVVASNRTGGFEFDNLALNAPPNVVALPATGWLVGLGLLGLSVVAARSRRRSATH